jgi:hypothetical protein
MYKYRQIRYHKFKFDSVKSNAARVKAIVPYKIKTKTWSNFSYKFVLFTIDSRYVFLSLK